MESFSLSCDRQFPCSPAGIAQVLSLSSPLSHQVSDWGWKHLLLTLHLPAARHRAHNMPQPCQELPFHTNFCLETNYFQPCLFMRKHFEVCRLLTRVFFPSQFSLSSVSVSVAPHSAWAQGACRASSPPCQSQVRRMEKCPKASGGYDTVLSKAGKRKMFDVLLVH